MGGSLNNFEKLLLMARSMYCKGASLNQDIDVEEVVTKWPKTWVDARKHLVDVGCKDAKEFLICLSEDHTSKWDLLEKRSDECQYCGQKGTIPYYYLGLETKVKQWVSDSEMCKKMTQHWKKKETGYKELKDGTLKLSYGMVTDLLSFPGSGILHQHGLCLFAARLKNAGISLAVKLLNPYQKYEAVSKK